MFWNLGWRYTGKTEGGRCIHVRGEGLEKEYEVAQGVIGAWFEIALLLREGGRREEEIWLILKDMMMMMMMKMATSLLKMQASKIVQMPSI